jgi:PBSX family phage portal protein
MSESTVAEVSQEQDFIQKPQMNVTLIKKADNASVESNAMEREDAFEGVYFDGANGEGNVIRPPFDPIKLHELTTENNTLLQCIGAMEVNIDGTGHEVEHGDTDQRQEDDAVVSGALDFFKEPYPGQSFISQRRAIRRDLEATGNGYLEVMRNPAEDLVFVRPMDCTTMRIVKLGEPVTVDKEVMRGGKKVNIKVGVRERVFIQQVGTQFRYFKEYGASRDLNKKTGEWSDNKLPAKDRASEVIHFTVIKDPASPYGLPRWISQIPSVLGSRSAEELNLDYFDSGGIPPAIIFLSGGMIAEGSKGHLNSLLSGKAKAKNRGAVVEAHATSGDIGSAGNVRVQVERFGSERQADSMFEGYDDKCERRVRGAFRLPPLFVGKAEDYSFATAFASYTIAEAQVFKPEREEFDEIITNTLLREITGESYIFRSRDLVINNSESQMQAVKLAADKGVIDRDMLVDTLNEITNLNMKASDVADLLGAIPKPEPEPTDDPEAVTDNTDSAGASTPVSAPTAKVSKADPFEISVLAKEWVQLSGGLKGGASVDSYLLKARVETLTKQDRQLFDAAVSTLAFSAAHHDFDGAEDLAACTCEVMGAEHDD